MIQRYELERSYNWVIGSGEAELDSARMVPNDQGDYVRYEDVPRWLSADEVPEFSEPQTWIYGTPMKDRRVGLFLNRDDLLSGTGNNWRFFRVPEDGGGK